MTYLDVVATAIKKCTPDDALPEDNAIDLFRSYAVLLLAKGEAVTGEDVHNAWVAWMASRGLVHDSMVPFKDLPPATQAEDSPFVLAIRAAARYREGIRNE